MKAKCLGFILVFTGVMDQDNEITVVSAIKKSPKLFREAQTVVQLELIAVVDTFFCKYLKQLKPGEEPRSNINSWKVLKTD